MVLLDRIERVHAEGLVWRRANRWGALASLLTALATNFTLYYLTHQPLDHWDANVFLAALLSGIAALVIVSRLTAPEPAEAMESFWTRLDTSSDDEVQKPLLLVHLLDLPRMVRERGWAVFREDLGGFAAGVVMVLLLVAGTAIFLAS